MEEAQRISYRDVEDVVAAFSEAAGRIVPGMSLSYREQLVRRGSWGRFDAMSFRLVLDSPGLDPCVACSVCESLDKFYFSFLGRAKLLEKLASDGWPSARSGAEARLKIAAAGDRAFEKTCFRYSKGGYARI